MQRQNTTEMESGNIKKYLYAGNKKEDEEQYDFTPKTTDNKTPSGVPVDLSNVWSIQKNVSPATPTFGASDHLNHNVNKGFYSRHGVMRDLGKNTKPPEKSDIGSAWAPARGSSLAFAVQNTGSGSDRGRTSGSAGQSGGPGGPLDDGDF